MTPLAHLLARWAARLEPSGEDLALARRSLVDTVAVALSAADDPMGALGRRLGSAARWAALAHVRDFDDLHLESTSHVSAVCVPAAMAAGGDARAYLAGAGVMARLGGMLGWRHYARGWHATCTAGAPAAAVTAAVAMGAGEPEIATAIALAVPAAGGVQRAFGTAAKSLQVGFAADAGVRAAQLAAAGATADAGALDQWLTLVAGADGGRAAGTDAAVDLATGGPAVPGGLAVKIFPCCYALQRPMSAARALCPAAGDIDRVVVRTPAATLQPLIHDRPRTGLEGKFSLPYGVAAALIDEHPGFGSFTDEAVNRPQARALAARVEVEAIPGGDWLLAGDCTVEVHRRGGATEQVTLQLPPGAPGGPPHEEGLREKVIRCAGPLADDVLGVSWDSAAAVLEDGLKSAPLRS